MMAIEDMLILSIFIIIQGMILFFVFFLLRKRQVWALIRLGLSGHGTLVQKILPDNGSEFLYSSKPVNKIFWKFKDKAGKVKKYFQPIEGIKHTLAGTSIPLHICPFNTQTNISILEEKNKELTAKETNELINYSYLEGVIDTRKMLMAKAGFGIDPKILIILGVFVVIAIIMWPQISAQMAGA